MRKKADVIKMKRVAIIGAGAMGGGIARGMLATASVPSAIVISNPSQEKLSYFLDAGCCINSSNVKAVSTDGVDLVFVCVKPWKVEEVLTEIAPSLKKGVTVGVVAAGVSGERIAACLPEEVNSYIVMPNTGLNIGQSMTILVDVRPSEESRRRISNVLWKLGQVMTLDESRLPAATAIASCGIAYLMRYARAAEQAGVQMGLRPAEARRLAAAALRAAGGLLDFPDAHPETEIDKVTTPGGLTIRGLNTLDEQGFSNAVIKALLASR